MNPILRFYTPEMLAKMSDDEIKAASAHHSFSISDLKNEGKIDHERYRRLTYISTDEHYVNILRRFGDELLLAKYNDSYIKELIDDGDISRLDLKTRGILKPDELARIMGEPPEPVEAGEFRGLSEVLAELPVLSDDRVDLFVLGVAGSGKTSFLSGVLKGAKDAGNLDLPMMLDEQGNATNKWGIMYANHLINSVEQNLPAKRTQIEFLTYVSLNFRDNQNRIHPLSFMEMSGELFQDCYGKNRSELHPKLQTFLFHENQKMLFCVIDYHVHSTHKVLDEPQWMHFSWFLQMLDANGTLSRCLAITILITKWDLAVDQSPAAAKAFLEREYMQLYRLCEGYASTYGLTFQIVRFSLGYFDARNAVTYNPTDSQKVIDWLCNETPSLGGKKKKWYQF